MTTTFTDEQLLRLARVLALTDRDGEEYRFVIDELHNRGIQPKDCLGRELK